MSKSELKSVHIHDRINSNGFNLVVRFTNVSFVVPLNDGLNADEILHSTYGTILYTVRSEVTSILILTEHKPFLREIIKDLISIHTNDKVTLAFNVKKSKLFLQRWEVGLLRKFLLSYDLPKKLPIESAVQVVKELYVEQVMES